MTGVESEGVNPSLRKGKNHREDGKANHHPATDVLKRRTWGGLGRRRLERQKKEARSFLV